MHFNDNLEFVVRFCLVLPIGRSLDACTAAAAGVSHVFLFPHASMWFCFCCDAYAQPKSQHSYYTATTQQPLAHSTFLDSTHNMWLIWSNLRIVCILMSQFAFCSTLIASRYARKSHWINASQTTTFFSAHTCSSSSRGKKKHNKSVICALTRSRQQKKFTRSGALKRKKQHSASTHEIQIKCSSEWVIDKPENFCATVLKVNWQPIVIPIQKEKCFACLFRSCAAARSYIKIFFLSCRAFRALATETIELGWPRDLAGNLFPLIFVENLFSLKFLRLSLLLLLLFNLFTRKKVISRGADYMIRHT